MADDVFTDPANPTDETGADSEKWVDVRMTDPEEGEWDVDVVVVEGQVNYVDLRVRPDVVAGFVECLVEDVGDERASDILSTVAARQGVTVAEDVDGSERSPDENGGVDTSSPDEDVAVDE